ncbi:MAG: LPS-assembly protein LptD [Methylophilaceae bacterium]
MLKNHVFTGISAALLLLSLSTQAEVAANPIPISDAIVIDGDKLELHLDRQMRAIGNASLHRDKQDIFGDIIEYDVQNDELHAVGNVSIELGDANLHGPELNMRLSESIGDMRDATINITKALGTKAQRSTVVSPARAPQFTQQSGVDLTAQDNDNPTSLAPFSTTLGTEPLPPQSRGDASVLFFEGLDKKRLLDARYTTCKVGVDDWYLKAKELKLNGYSESGIAQNGYVEFKGVPILYSPYVAFSYGGQRKSGFLAPSYGSTSLSGFEFSIPYYWNISPNRDATITMRELSKRGIQLQGQFRYLEEKYSGIANLEYLPSDNQTGNNRYYTNLKHQQSLGNGWSAGYAFEKTSDNLYFSELSTRITSTSRVLLPQQFNVDYADETWRFNGIAQQFQTLDGVSYPYERLPQLTLSGSKNYGDIKANLYTQLVAFDANSSNINAALLTTGTRLTAYPSLTESFSRSYGYITPKVGVHMTSYTLNNDPNSLGPQQRALPILSVDSGLYFDREFKIANRAYAQTLEPRLFYVYIPNTDQSKIPVFDSGVIDLNFSSLFAENQFSGNDRINNANQISAGLTTRFIESDTGMQRLSASIGQRYYFSDQKVALDYKNPASFRQSNSSDIIAGLSANLKTNWKVDAFLRYNTLAGVTPNQTITSRYSPEPGKVLNLSYSHRNDAVGTMYFAQGTSDLTKANAIAAANVDQFNVSGQWPLKPGWFAVGRINYAIQTKQMIESLAGVEYNAGCWIARSVIQRISTIATIPTATSGNANYALFFQLELGGLASIGANPLGIIKRSVPGYVNTGMIPETYQ